MASSTPAHLYGTGTGDLQLVCREETSRGWEPAFEAVSAGIPSSNCTMIGYGFRKADSKYSQFGSGMIRCNYIGLTILIDQLACIFVVLSLRLGTSKHSSSK